MHPRQLLYRFQQGQRQLQVSVQQLAVQEFEQVLQQNLRLRENAKLFGNLHHVQQLVPDMQGPS